MKAIFKSIRENIGWYFLMLLVVAVILLLLILICVIESVYHSFLSLYRSQKVIRPAEAYIWLFVAQSLLLTPPS